MAEAQGTMFVSNLGQTPTDSALIGSNSWISQTFITGVNPDGYTLNSVQLLLNSASGDPNKFNVMVYAKTGDPSSLHNPGDSPIFLDGLNGPTDPLNGGVFTYTSSGLTLSPSTYYFIVATASSDMAQGAYVWSAVNSLTHANGWTIDNNYFSSSDGLSWSWHARGDVFQMAINATAIPEPATCALLGVGLATLSLWRRKF